MIINLCSVKDNKNDVINMSQAWQDKGKIIIITLTFIYTAQIQLYSFQMRLTIKDLKIHRRKKKLQHYIRKGSFKKVSLQITFKNLKIGGASKI